MAVAQVGTLTSFSASTTIVSADVNQNFTDLKTAFNNLVTGTDTIATGLTYGSSTETLGFTAGVVKTGLFLTNSSGGGSTDSAALGGYNEVTANSTGGQFGILGRVVSTPSSGTQTALYGVRGDAVQQTAGGTTTNAYGVQGIVIATAGTVTNAAAILASSPSGSGTITNAYGVYIAYPAIGTNKIPLFVGGATEDVQFMDAGSAGASQQDWIEVTVGGNTGYIRVFASK